MSLMFNGAKSYNGAMSKWDVSRVTDMHLMFAGATSFTRGISKWDVSSVTNMDRMFSKAVSFKRRLCGAAWVHSKASKINMFEGSPGSISRKACTPPTRKYESRRPVPARELIVRTPTATSPGRAAVTPTIASTMMICPKCGTFAKSGRVSCCAPGGAWYKNCGRPGSRNTGHSWFEGTRACKCTFKGNGM